VIRTRQGSLRVPESLFEKVVAVLGFDERPVAATYRQRADARADSISFTPVQVAEAYQFPANKGKNQTIALIELDGGFRTSDLSAYWKQLGLNNVAITAVGVDGATNKPTGDPESADGEVALDIEVAGAVAPEARLAVYFAPNTDRGFLDAIHAAIHDTLHKPSVISISWGAPENQWTPQSMNAFNAAFQDAALLGITVCAASGDNGSSDGESDGASHVDFPASSPWVLACGGTSLVASGNKIQSEVVWHDSDGGATGGGVSTHFPKPDYQAVIPMSGRGVPDVAGNADPATGYRVIVDGKASVIGGTSAVAPLWAGLIALLNEQLGKNVGWLHPQLYGTIAQHKALRDVTSGTNDAYRAQTGWDACTGLGTPNGQAILAALKQR
jgi:kumamolisin